MWAGGLQLSLCCAAATMALATSIVTTPTAAVTTPAATTVAADATIIAGAGAGAVAVAAAHMCIPLLAAWFVSVCLVLAFFSVCGTSL